MTLMLFLPQCMLGHYLKCYFGPQLKNSYSQLLWESFLNKMSWCNCIYTASVKPLFIYILQLCKFAALAIWFEEMITRTLFLSFWKVTELKYYHWKKERGKNWDRRGSEWDQCICKNSSIDAGSLAVMYCTPKSFLVMFLNALKYNVWCF